MNANQMSHLLKSTKRCLNHVFLQEQQKNYQDRKSHMRKQLRGPMTWNDMLRNAWKGFANWQIKRQSNYTRFPVLAWTITKSKRKNRKTLVEWHKFDLILS